MSPARGAFWRLLAAAAASFAAFVAAQSAAPLPAGVDRVTSAEGITEYRLANGLRAVLVPDLSKPTITVNITYLVGSRHEGYGETGMAHLLEHLLFKGTPRHPKLNEEFGPRGARRNGTTWFDRTNYHETFPGSADNLRWALELEADRMVNARVAREDLDSEMTVVRNEYERGENEPMRVMFKRMNSVAFDWHNYQNAPIGNRSDIENVAIDNLRAFYRVYYQPDNAVLVVAGNFDEAQAVKVIAETFGPIPRPARALPKFWTVEPAQDGERTFAVRRRGGTPIVMVAYRIPGALHGDAMPLAFAGSVLAVGPSSRLHRLLVESGKAAAVSKTDFGTLEPGLIYLSAVLKPGASVDEVEKLLVEAAEGFSRTPVSEEEMERVRALLEKQHEQTLSSTESLALALTESIAKGDWRLFLHSRQQLGRVNAGEVAAAAKRYFVRDNRTVGFFLPSEELLRAQIPEAPGAEEVLRDFKAAPSMAAAETFDPAPANIDRRTTVRELPNGLKVALLPKKTRGGTVNVRLALHWGDVETLRGKAQVASLTAGMLERGSSRYSRQQIADRFNQLKMSGAIHGPNTAFRTTRDHLPEALRLAAHVLREPSFPAAEFEQLRNQVVTALEQRKSDVGAVAGERLNQHFNVYPPDDPRYQATSGEMIAAVRSATLDQVRAFHRDFYGASNAEIAVVGDFDERQVMAILEQELGGWKSPRPYARPALEYRDIAPLHATVSLADKANAMFVARRLLPVHADDPDYPALSLANYLFGGGAGPASRLNGRMRQREGLTYGVTSALSTNHIDRVATLGVSASVAPQNMPRVERAFQEELERVFRDGFTAEEIAAAQSGWLQLAMQQRSNDELLALGWVDRLHRGKTYAETAAFEEKIRGATRDEVNAAARHHFDPSRFSTVKAGTLEPAR